MLQTCSCGIANLVQEFKSGTVHVYARTQPCEFNEVCCSLAALQGTCVAVQEFRSRAMYPAACARTCASSYKLVSQNAWYGLLLPPEVLLSAEGQPASSPTTVVALATSYVQARCTEPSRLASHVEPAQWPSSCAKHKWASKRRCVILDECHAHGTSV